jgi:hypothetical protein
MVGISFDDHVEGYVDLSAIPEGELEFISSPSQELKNDKAIWTLSGPAGSYYLDFTHNGKTYTREVLIDDYKYLPPEEVDDGTKMSINNKKLRPLGDLSIFGWKPGWLAFYILFSITISMTLRKLLKIH